MNLIPQPSGPQPEPSNRPAFTTTPRAIRRGPNAQPANFARKGMTALAVAAVAAVAAIGWQLQSGSATESNHANWQQVREASARPKGEIRWQDAGGAVAFLPAIAIGDGDRDRATTDAVRAALLAGDDAKVGQILAAVHAAPPAPPPLLPASSPNIPVPAPAPTQTATPTPAPLPAPDVQKPTLTDGMKAEIRRGDADFFHLYLYDCCDEDGDIVDVILNGQLFQQVKLTNRGATITLPVAANGSTKIELRGVYDGGGGITIGCRTSRGHGFLRAMSVGETQFLGTVRN